MSETGIYHVAHLVNGRSVIYTSSQLGTRWLNPMYVEPRRGDQGQTYLHFIPMCEFGESDESNPVTDCHVLVRYEPSPDVVRIYNLFLADFTKARAQAKTAREQSAAATADNVTMMATAKIDK